MPIVIHRSKLTCLYSFVRSLERQYVFKTQRCLRCVFYSCRAAKLEKRPTFDALDKRKSWSVVDTSVIGGSLSSVGGSQASSAAAPTARSQNHINKR